MTTLVADTRAGAGGDRLGWAPHVALLAALWLALLVLFAHDAAAIATIWWSSSTFGHCLFIPPIIAWLVWQRRRGLAQVAPRGWAPGLLIVAAGAGGWLLGQAAGVGVARHLGLALMLQGAVVTVLGPAVARALLFPLVYVIALVPMGEGLEPPLQTLTARMCMVLLHAAGIPARIQGVFITVPGGWFEVAEACSGAKFLIAMIAYGVLVANVCFVSWWRRLAFLAAAIVVPVLANGVRAFATIYVASRRGIRFAGDFDHVVYGWFFFGFVIALVMAAAWRFFDRPRRDPWFDPVALDPTPHGHDPRRAARIALAALALAAAPPLWSAAIAAQGTAAVSHRLDLPAVPGWRRVALTGPGGWAPSYAAPDHSLIGRYRDGAGHEVDLAIVVYLRQDETRELVRYGQGAAGADSGWTWSADDAPPPLGRAEIVTGPAGIEREVVSFYRVGDVTTGSDMRVKIETLRVRLLGGPQRAVAVLASARQPGGRAAIDALLRALGPVDALVDRMLGRRPLGAR